MRANLLTRVMYRVAKRRFGEVPEPFAVAAHHPRLLVANAVHETMLQSASRTLPPSVRELAVFWAARTIGCSWCCGRTVSNSPSGSVETMAQV
jgi:alkylhydroperoxidase family enzyme